MLFRSQEVNPSYMVVNEQGDGVSAVSKKGQVKPLAGDLHLIISKMYIHEWGKVVEKLSEKTVIFRKIYPSGEDRAGITMSFGKLALYQIRFSVRQVLILSTQGKSKQLRNGLPSLKEHLGCKPAIFLYIN